MSKVSETDFYKLIHAQLEHDGHFGAAAALLESSGISTEDIPGTRLRTLVLNGLGGDPAIIRKAKSTAQTDSRASSDITAALDAQNTLSTVDPVYRGVDPGFNVHLAHVNTTVNGMSPLPRVAAFSPDGRFFAFGGDGGYSKIASVEDTITANTASGDRGAAARHAVYRVGCRSDVGPVCALAFHPFLPVLAIGYREGVVALVSFKRRHSGTPSAEYEGKVSGVITSLLWDGSGSCMYVGTQQSPLPFILFTDHCNKFTCYAPPVPPQHMRRSLTGSAVTCMAIGNDPVFASRDETPDSAILAAGCSNGLILLFSCVEMKIVGYIATGCPSITGVALSRGSSRVYCSGSDGTFKSFKLPPHSDMHGLKIIEDTQELRNESVKLATTVSRVSQSSRRHAADGHIRLRGPAKVSESGTHSVSAAPFAPAIGGYGILQVINGSEICIVNGRSGSSMMPSRAVSGSVTAVAASVADNRTIFVTCGQNGATLWHGSRR